jgi:hypothetical protein
MRSDPPRSERRHLIFMVLLSTGALPLSSLGEDGTTSGSSSSSSRTLAGSFRSAATTVSVSMSESSALIYPRISLYQSARHVHLHS